MISWKTLLLQSLENISKFRRVVNSNVLLTFGTPELYCTVQYTRTREGSKGLLRQWDGLDRWRGGGSTACRVGLPVHVDEIGPTSVDQVVEQAEHLQQYYMLS